MAYVLVAVGALMSVLGLYGIVTGARIVQVEAGWTSVIAGSMLFVGGVLTIALGFVLRALVQLKAGLHVQPAAPVVEPSGMPLAAPSAPDFGDEPPTMQEPSIAGPSTGEDPAAPEVSPKIHPLRKAKAPAKEGPTTADDLAPAVVVPHTLRPAEPPPSEPAEQAPAVTPADALSSEWHPTPDDPEPANLDAIEAAHPADDYKLETPSPPAHDLPAPPPGTLPALAQSAAEPDEVDWLDRAFADIDEELPVRKRAHEPVAAPHAAKSNPVSVESRDTEPAPVEPETAHTAAKEPPSPAAAEPPAPTSAVIGRYEADGTSYVMYADGSIEAHSEAGSYRFASMTELKAFIET